MLSLLLMLTSGGGKRRLLLLGNLLFSKSGVVWTMSGCKESRALLGL